MELVRGIHNLKSWHHGCVLTVGNFDGFHRGHQALITKLCTEGRRLNLPVVVMIFEPQPQEYFIGKAAPARLFKLRDKLKYLTAASVDIILCVNFNKQFASLSAHSFVSDLLVEQLGVRLIIVGDDFRFGAQRHGNVELLQQIGKKAGFDVINTVTYYTEGGKRVSSTSIREALAQDRLAEAEILLGHPYHISGRVVHGDALGRMIGFPTANVYLKGRQAPINGVYAVEVFGIDKLPIPGVANIGNRPTVAGLCQQLEVHLLDIDKDLYRYYLEVAIRAKIRKEQQFFSIEDLKKQIFNDVISVRNFFKLKTS